MESFLFFSPLLLKFTPHFRLLHVRRFCPLEIDRLPCGEKSPENIQVRAEGQIQALLLWLLVITLGKSWAPALPGNGKDTSWAAHLTGPSTGSSWKLREYERPTEVKLSCINEQEYHCDSVPRGLWRGLLAQIYHRPCKEFLFCYSKFSYRNINW